MSKPKKFGALHALFHIFSTISSEISKAMFSKVYLLQNNLIINKYFSFGTIILSLNFLPKDTKYWRKI